MPKSDEQKRQAIKNRVIKIVNLELPPESKEMSDAEEQLRTLILATQNELWKYCDLSRLLLAELIRLMNTIIQEHGMNVDAILSSSASLINDITGYNQINNEIGKVLTLEDVRQVATIAIEPENLNRVDASYNEYSDSEDERVVSFRSESEQKVVPGNSNAPDEDASDSGIKIDRGIRPSDVPVMQESLEQEPISALEEDQAQLLALFEKFHNEPLVKDHNPIVNQPIAEKENPLEEKTLKPVASNEFKHPNLSNTQLLGNAFKPAVTVLNDASEFLKQLYNNAEPDYAMNGSGTIPENTVLDESQVSIIHKYNEQMLLVINSIKAGKEKFKYTDLHIENLDSFYGHITRRNYYTKQDAAYYATIKKGMEQIAYKLTLDHVPTGLKITLMEDLLDNIAACGPGIGGHISATNIFLSMDETIEAWLAQLRFVIITQLANQHQWKKFITENNSSHVKNVFLMYAKDNNFNQAGYDQVSAINEIHYNLAEVNDDDLSKFYADFMAQYSPAAIMLEIASRLHSMIFEKLQKVENPLELQSPEKYLESLKGIPFASCKAAFFNSEEITKLDGEIIFHYHLKTIEEVKLALTRVFLEEMPIDLFQGIYYTLPHDEKRELLELNNIEIAHEDAPVTISMMPGSMGVWYLSSSEGIVPLTRVKPTQSLLRHFISLDVAISLDVYRYFAETIRDFSGCHFDFDIFELSYLKGFNYQDCSYKQSRNVEDQKGVVQFISVLCQDPQPVNLDRTLFLRWMDKSLRSLVELTAEHNNPALMFGVMSVLSNRFNIETMLSNAVKNHYWDNFICIIRHNQFYDSFANSHHCEESIFHIISRAVPKAARDNRIDVLQAMGRVVTRARIINYNEVDGNDDAVSLAVRNNNPAMLRWLIGIGAVRDRIPEGKSAFDTPVGLASGLKYWECVSVLVGTTPYVWNEVCVTEVSLGVVLLHAILYRYTPMITAVINVASNFKTHVARGKKTSLHLVVDHKDELTLKMILPKLKASMGQLDRNNGTACYRAAESGQWNLVKLFIEVKDVNVFSLQAKQVIKLAVEAKELDIAVTLFKLIDIKSNFTTEELDDLVKDVFKLNLFEFMKVCGSKIYSTSKLSYNAIDKAINLALEHKSWETLNCFIDICDSNVGLFDDLTSERTLIRLVDGLFGKVKPICDDVKVISRVLDFSKKCSEYINFNPVAVLETTRLNMTKLASMILSLGNTKWIVDDLDNSHFHYIAQHNNTELAVLALRGIDQGTVNKNKKGLLPLDVAIAHRSWGCAQFYAGHDILRRTNSVKSNEPIIYCGWIIQLHELFAAPLDKLVESPLSFHLYVNLIRHIGAYMDMHFPSENSAEKEDKIINNELLSKNDLLDYQLLIIHDHFTFLKQSMQRGIQLFSNSRLHLLQKVYKEFVGVHPIPLTPPAAVETLKQNVIPQLKNLAKGMIHENASNDLGIVIYDVVYKGLDRILHPKEQDDQIVREYIVSLIEACENKVNKMLFNKFELTKLNEMKKILAEGAVADSQQNLPSSIHYFPSVTPKV